MSARYEFIVNPQARSGRGKRIWERMEPELKRRKIDFDVYITEKKGHAGEIAGRLSGPGQQRTIVVLGGDGTVNEVINGLNVSENITLGYIPVGSGNDFARGLGIPEKPEKALGAVLSPAKIGPNGCGGSFRTEPEPGDSASAGAWALMRRCALPSVSRAGNEY